MHPIINDILTELKAEFGITRFELERMVDCQFKCIENNIRDRSLKTVNLIHIGKIRPTGWFKHNVETVLKRKKTVDEIKQAKRDISRLEELSIQQGGSEDIIRQEEDSLQQLSPKQE